MEINELIGLKTGSRNLAWTTSEGTKTVPSCIGEELDIHNKVINYIFNKPENKLSKYPLNRGIVTNASSQNLLIKLLEHTQIPRFSNLVVAAPETELTEGQNMLKDAIIKALSPNKDFILYPESFCGAVYKMGVDTALNNFFTALNLGSTSTGIGVFTPIGEKRKLVLTATNDVSGSSVDEKILQRLKNTYGSVVVNISKIQDLKEKSSLKLESNAFTPIDIIEGTHQKTKDCTSEFQTELDLYAQDVSNLFVKIFSLPSSTFRYDMINSPVILTGGMVNIPGMSQRIKKYIDEKTNANIDLQTVEDGHLAPAKGGFLLAGEQYS
jgi:hypothetical protein